MRRVALIAALLVASCASEDDTPPPPPACPPNIYMGGMCVWRELCVPAPEHFDRTLANQHYPDCPASITVPASESTRAAGTSASILAGMTCEERRARLSNVCCYRYADFCAR